MPVQFLSETIPFNIDNSEQIELWLLDVFKSEGGFKDAFLNIVACTDEELLEINKKYLDHDYYTDIITFPIEENDELIEAELYISLERVAENAKMLNVAYEKELYRVFVHGVLHLCGYGDKSSEEELKMRNKEDEYLSQLK